MMREDRIQNILNTLDRVKSGAKDAYGEGKEDHRAAMKVALEQKGIETDSTMWNQMMGSNATVTRARELLGQADPEFVKARKEMGMGLSEDRATKIGQVLGTIASDITQDRTRNIYWLLNAAQATTNVIQDGMLKKYAPDLFKSSVEQGVKSNQGAVARGLRSPLGYNKKGVSERTLPDGSKEFMKRDHEPGNVASLGWPAGIAVNSAVGLMNPFGGQEGYNAVFESEEDPSKTSNAVAEVAAKYFIGKTGNLLKWDEFKKVRPDVSKGEYMAYKAFKFDKETDLNPMDGDVTLPLGLIKYTNEGIHGPEVQFLGRSLPVATGIIPAAAAIAATTYGARRGGVKGGMKAGLLTTGAAMLTGNVIEGERRRRNAEENETDTMYQ